MFEVDRHGQMRGTPSLGDVGHLNFVNLFYDPNVSWKGMKMEGREVRIKRVDNGWLVRYGCLELAFTSEEHLVSEFARWARAPEVVEQEYAARYRKIPMPGAYTDGADMPREVGEASAEGLARDSVSGMGGGRLR